MRRITPRMIVTTVIIIIPESGFLPFIFKYFLLLFINLSHRLFLYPNSQWTHIISHADIAEIIILLSLKYDEERVIMGTNWIGQAIS